MTCKIISANRQKNVPSSISAYSRTAVGGARESHAEITERGSSIYQQLTTIDYEGHVLLIYD